MKTVIKPHNQILLIVIALAVVLYAYFVVYGENRGYMEAAVDAIQERVLTKTVLEFNQATSDIDRMAMSLNEFLATNPNREGIENFINMLVLFNSGSIDGVNVVAVGDHSVITSQNSALNYSADGLKNLLHYGFIIEHFQGRYYFSRIIKSGGHIVALYVDFSKIFNPSFIEAVKKRFEKFNTGVSFFIGFKDKESDVKVFVDEKGIFQQPHDRLSTREWFKEHLYLSNVYTEEAIYYLKPVEFTFDVEVFTISDTLKKAIIVVLLGLCLVLIFINFIISRDVTKPLMVLIKKMNDFRLGIENRATLPYARKDIVGELMREFSNLYTDLRDKTDEAVTVSKQLEIKEKYLTQKLYEMKKMRDLIVKSFTLSDLNSLVVEFLQIVKDVFQADYSALYRIVVEDNVSRLIIDANSISGKKGEIYEKIKPAVKKIFKDNSVVRHFSIEIDNESHNIMIAQIKTNDNVLGCFVAVRKKGDFTKQEEDVAATFADQSAIIFENNRLHRQEIEKLKLEIEMASAKEIQEVVIKRHLDVGDIVKLKTFYQPAVNIGGDWYDCIKIDNNKIAFMIADITGHGVASALVTVAFSTYFRMLSELFGKSAFNQNSLSEIVAGLNRILISLSGGLKQATLAVALYDSSKGTLEYISAGHNSSMLYQKSSKKLTSLQTVNMRLGDEINSTFVAKTLDIASGDILFLYTDGLIENKGRNGVEYGKKRLRKLIGCNLGIYDINQIGDKLIADVSAECNFDALEDDITFMFVEIK